MKRALIPLTGDGRLVSVVGRLALAAALAVAVILPLGYFAVTYQGLAAHLKLEAQGKAAVITALASGNPELWMYQVQRIEELLARYPVPLEDVDSATVRDAADQLVVSVGKPPGPLVLRHSRPVYESGRVIGSVEIAHPLRGLMLGTALAALLGLLLGGVVYATLRRMTAALLAEKERYVTAIESAMDGYAVVGGKGRFIEVNATLCALTGYSRDELLRLTVAELEAVETESETAAHIASIIASGRDRFETRWKKKDGAVIDIEATVTHRAQDGSEFFCFFRDITGRKQGEKALKESEDRYRDLVEHSQDLICTYDLDGHLLSVNPWAAKVLGYTPDEMLKMEMREFLAPSVRHEFDQHLATIRKEGAARGLMLMQTRTGEKRLWEYSNTVRTEGLPRPIVRGMAHDITERRRAEEALKESERRFRGLIEQALSGIYVIQDRKLAYANLRMAELLGYPLEEIIGADPDIFVVAEDLPLARARIRALLDAPLQQSAAYSLRVRRKDGAEAVLGLNTLHTLFDGKPAVIGMAQDVTERMRAEEVRKQLEAQLRESQKMEAIGTLAGGIAHDFNNILGAIIGNVALARRDVGAGHPVLVSLEEIHKASQRAKDLVQQILVFSRKQPQQFRLIALRAVVEDAVKLLRASVPAGVELATVVADTPLYVLADLTQIEQVLLNLCTNAWHAMEGRPGRIEIGLDEVMVNEAAVSTLPGLRPGRHARVSVHDNGKGMDAATQGRIFEPFFTTKKFGQGTGLGLSVVHGIIQAHHGAITVQSAPGEGTTFQIYFPAVDGAPADALPEPEAPGSAQGGGEHVLYVDDDEAMVFLVTRMLEGLGYRTSGYERAEEALAAVRADPGDFDLVVTDYNMPGLSGLDVALGLARIRPDLPVVITSGYITEELRVKAVEAGVRHLVYKPNTVDELCEAIRQILTTGNGAGALSPNATKA